MMRQRLHVLRWFWCLLWLGMVFEWPHGVLAQETRSLEAILAGVATELAQRFPAVSGEVVKVEGEQLYLSLGARDHIVEGVQLTLVREGEVLKRSTSGEALGRLEEELGIVTVAQVFENYAIATVTQLKSKEPVRSGDKVRITAGRISLGILPVVVQTRQPVPADEMAGILQQVLEGTGRFRVVSRDQVSIWLLKRGALAAGVVPPELLPELAQALQLSYVLMPLVRDLRGTTILETLLLIPAQPQTPLATASAILPAAAQARRAPEHCQSRRRRLWRRLWRNSHRLLPLTHPRVPNSASKEYSKMLHPLRQ
jgi:Flagellar assembly protein T, C-terminal domain